MAWAYLVAAGLFEIGWPLGLKKGYGPDGLQIWWIVFAIVTMTASGALLMMAQRTIPMGTAYAVWAGIGAAGGQVRKNPFLMAYFFLDVLGNRQAQPVEARRQAAEVEPTRFASPE